MDSMGEAPSEQATVAVERRDSASPIVLLCDHASNRLPARYGSLGLREADLLEHFAWDPGALAVCRRLSDMLDAPLVHGLVSRLILDVNRSPSDPDSIVATADDALVPGNQGLTADERARRVADVYAPYHSAVEALLARRAEAGRATALVAIHTFTPVMRGAQRPWHCGVIFDADRRLADPLVAGLRAEPGLVVGVNQPYAPSDRVYHTLARHAEASGAAAVMIEIRNDLVRDGDGQEAWAARLAPLLQAAARDTLQTGGREAAQTQRIS